MSVLIRGGRVITAADDYIADVFVEGERISLVGESLDVTADRTIDAHGKYLLPGCIDPHTHLDMPFGGTTTIDDVESGQTSAAFGGTTCHVDFIIQPQRRTFADAEADVSRLYQELGLGELQRHHTGHGIGLEGHEWPFIDKGSADVVIEENMVLSIEPGLYVPGLAGFRHSDTVVVTKNGCQRLTYYPRDLESMTVRL